MTSAGSRAAPAAARARPSRARMAPAGLGSDTGGSVRIPAALNGIAGLRPTVGRYNGEGITPISHTRDTAGPMARTVGDLVLLDQVITGDMQPVKPGTPERDTGSGGEDAVLSEPRRRKSRRSRRARSTPCAQPGSSLIDVEIPGLARSQRQA